MSSTQLADRGAPAPTTADGQHGPAQPPAAVLPEAVRQLGAFAAFGSGLMFFALASDVLVASTPDLSGWYYGPAGAMLVWAVLQTAWAVAFLRAGDQRPSFVSRLLLATLPALLPIACTTSIAVLGWSAFLVPPTTRTLSATLISAVVLQLILLSCLGYLRRRVAAAPKPARPPSAGRLLAAMFASALLVARVATPGLAASTAGDFAVPHGEHETGQPGPMPQPSEPHG
ncbi:hypothetical protein, partial [Arthrobacter sp. H5]|uniref:hypothetical protein n=1 Tax=Arthrobacter sp. H5 TaxID=1267973 RepID=UPI00138B1B83